jgi:hypothetical protein
MSGPVAGGPPNSPPRETWASVGRQADVLAHMKRWPIGTEPIASWIRPSCAAMTRNGVNVCPQAWFLARCDIPVDEQARLRLEAGTREHRRIGRRTDLLRAAEKIEVVLLVVMAVLAAGAALVAVRGGL